MTSPIPITNLETRLHASTRAGGDAQPDNSGDNNKPDDKKPDANWQMRYTLIGIFLLTIMAVCLTIYYSSKSHAPVPANIPYPTAEPIKRFCKIRP